MIIKLSNGYEDELCGLVEARCVGFYHFRYLDFCLKISSLMLVIFSWIFSVYVLPVFHADWMLMLRFDIVVVTALDTLDRGSFISVCGDAPLHSAPGHDPVANGIGGEV